MRWYSEKIKYDFKKAKFSASTGHFTQMIWKSCKKVGFGLAFSKVEDSIIAYVVANYDPAGNIKSKFKDNVRPIKKD